MWSNYLLFGSIIIAYILAVAVLLIPASNPFMWALFEDLEFCTVKPYPDVPDHPGPVQGPCYPQYNWFILGVCALDTVITYVVEAFFISKFTVRYDNIKENQKLQKFAQEMERLIPHSYSEPGSPTTIYSR